MIKIINLAFGGMMLLGIGVTIALTLSPLPSVTDDALIQYFTNKMFLMQIGIILTLVGGAGYVISGIYGYKKQISEIQTVKVKNVN